MAMLERCSATPAAARQYWEWFGRLDISDVLRAVRSPTRVLYAPTSPEPEAVVRRVAELIPQAGFYRLPPTPTGAAIGEAWIQVWLHVEEAATGVRHSSDADRFFGTMLFTDVVGSTKLLARIGDAEYRALRATHERQVRLEVEQSGGRLISVTGDGTFSLFDGPTHAVRCADEIRKGAKELGISVRAGVHTGALERTGRDFTGLSVHIGARRPTSRRFCLPRGHLRRCSTVSRYAPPVPRHGRCAQPRESATRCSATASRAGTNDV